ncbi:hypothetical protein L7F22_000089 [Adiantum nelumboides]|nr:hypothetical protein [Adiantum nelumboides]
MLVALGVFGAVFLVAFLDYCPPRTCSSSAVLVSVGGSLVVAAAAGIAGLAMTVLRVVERRPAWPFALATLAVTGCAVVFGAVHYASAIGLLTHSRVDSQNACAEPDLAAGTVACAAVPPRFRGQCAVLPRGALAAPATGEGVQVE